MGFIGDFMGFNDDLIGFELQTGWTPKLGELLSSWIQKDDTSGTMDTTNLNITEKITSRMSLICYEFLKRKACCERWISSFWGRYSMKKSTYAQQFLRYVESNSPFWLCYHTSLHKTMCLALQHYVLSHFHLRLILINHD